jgi:predicted nucleic acid-binding protein
VIDANVFLRFLTNDDPSKAANCAALLKRLEAGEQAYLPDLVLADVVWTLESFYKQPKNRIRELMLSILSLKGLHFSSKEVARSALAIYSEKNIDWTDAFIVAQMKAKKYKYIYSYDHHFDRVSEVIRKEP